MSPSTPVVGCPVPGIPPTPKEELKGEIDLLRSDPKKVLCPDILVVGSGPIGAVFARKLVGGKKKVLMIDMGEQASKLVGEHRKNSVAVQKDISLFTNIIRGVLAPLSVSVTDSFTQLPPESSWTEGFETEEVPAKTPILFWS